MLQQATLKFLTDLKKNNNKPWMDAHRSRYEAAKADFGQFVEQVLKGLSKKDPSVAHLAAKDCTFRINRDIRFSKNKEPYKTNMGAFINKGGKKAPMAGYYLHLEPGGSFMGGGLYMPMPDVLKKVRQEIDYNLGDFKKIISAKKFKSVYGDLSRDAEFSLSRVPKGYEPDNPAAEYLKLKSFVATVELKDREVISASFLKQALTAFAALQPVIAFLNQATED
ncbi:MAG TPA: DUF2461 domain-containing protein [Lacibacter sp.]|nr:DUF2461 domain-containing protein [Lacibacter sp.]HMO88570.1 DUF2461 domain-containing protein [Lacibacter sp.]